MSKHRHKSNEGNKIGRNQFNGATNNNPFGISPQQLLGLLGGNIDMTGIGNMLSSMGKDGFDLNSFNQQFTGMNNGFNGDNIVDNISKSNKKSKSNEDNDNLKKEKHKSSHFQECNVDEEDENIELLKAVKRIIDPNRVEFIDKIIELYSNGMFDDK
jgi:hypothetical protein